MERKQESLEPMGKGSGHNNPLRSLIYRLFYKGGRVQQGGVHSCFHVKTKEERHGGSGKDPSKR
jgi:hypothetical protein